MQLGAVTYNVLKDMDLETIIKTLEATGFEGVYIPSAGHDAGISMGAALYQYNHELNQPRAKAIFSAYTGSRFSNEEIEIFLQSRNIKYRRLDNEALYDVVTDKLIEPVAPPWQATFECVSLNAIAEGSVMATLFDSVQLFPSVTTTE